MHAVVVLKDRFLDGGHSAQPGVSQHHRIKPGADRQADRSSGFGPGGTGAVLAPIGKLALPVHEGELELSGPGEGLAIDGDLPAVAENRRSGVQVEASEKAQERKNKK